MPPWYNRKKKRLFHGNQFTLTQLHRKRGNMMQENDEPSVIPDSLDSGDARPSPPLFDSRSSSVFSETLSDESEMELEVGYKAFESSTISASYKKMVLAKQVLEGGHADSQAEDDLVDHSEAVTGYRFVSMNQLADLCTLLRCPECSCDALTLQENHDRCKRTFLLA